MYDQDDYIRATAVQKQPEQPPTQIETQVGRQEELVFTIQERLGNLETKLRPILFSTPHASPGQESDRSALAPLPEALANVADKLETIVNWIDRLSYEAVL